MPIHRLLEKHTFGPDEIRIPSRAAWPMVIARLTIPLAIPKSFTIGS
jgi:hypothetical protein